MHAAVVVAVEDGEEEKPEATDDGAYDRAVAKNSLTRPHVGGEAVRVPQPPLRDERRPPEAAVSATFPDPATYAATMAVMQINTVLCTPATWLTKTMLPCVGR